MTRKITVSLMILMLVIALCGCGLKSAVNTIEPWDTTDEQAEDAIGILTYDGNYAFAEFNIDESFKSAKMGVEYYQDSKLIKDEQPGTVKVKKTSNGMAGFCYRDERAVMGISFDGSLETINARLTGFEKKDDEVLSFTSLSELQDITDGKKIYLGIINSGSDTLDATVLTDPDSKEGLKGKSMLIYIIFSTEPVD